MTLPIEHFLTFLGERGHTFKSYQDLYQWSVRDLESFWSCVWDFVGVTGLKTDRHSVQGSMHEACFFQGSTLNVAEHFLRGSGHKERLVFHNDRGHRCTLTMRDMRERVAALQDYFRRKGLAPGDRVAAYMPSTPEAVLALLAVVSLGGVWSCAGLELGSEVLLPRLEQVEPRFLVASWGPHQKERACDVVQALQRGLPTVESTLLLPYAGIPLGEHCLGEELAHERRSEEALVFPQLPFDHPLYVVFSSGTTGKPKCIVHRAGGVLLQHAKEHILHCGLQKGDRFFFYSTCSWMMWQWSISVLMTEACLVLFDGSSLRDGGKILLTLAQEEKVTFFGSSASYYELIVKHKNLPALPSVRTVASTGSVLMKSVEESMRKSLFPSARIYSISGGTDLLSCFVIGNPLTPSTPGVIQGAGLAMDVAVVNDQGTNVYDQKGELVCRKPFPSMPLTFLGEGGAEAYYATYFSAYPGMWKQGDFALQHKDGSFILYGRSDSVLNPGGVRVGTGEIYAILHKIPWIRESLMTTVLTRGKEKMILLLVLHDGEELSQERCAYVRQHLRDEGSVYFMPAYVHAVPLLPRTHNGKVSEKAARNALHGCAVYQDALQDSQALNVLKHLYALYA